METLLIANAPATTLHPASVEAQTTWAPRSCQHCGANARFYKWLDGELEMRNAHEKTKNKRLGMDR